MRCEGGSRLRADLQVECIRDPSGEIFVQREPVVGLTVEDIRPLLESGGRVGELRGHADAVARFPHGALHDEIHAERVGDISGILP